LGGDPGVVDARQPERVEAAHALVADERVLEGRGERVADVQAAGDVGRGQDDRERRVLALIGGAEKASLFPFAGPAGLDRAGLVRLVEHRVEICGRARRHRKPSASRGTVARVGVEIPLWIPFEAGPNGVRTDTLTVPS